MSLPILEPSTSRKRWVSVANWATPVGYVIDILEVNDILSSKDWHLSPLQRSNSIHISVTLQHVPVVDEFLNDLKDSGQNVSLQIFLSKKLFIYLD
ncbi:putative sphinganine-1-phosphate aldolase [Helianthus anomalus]